MAFTGGGEGEGLAITLSLGDICSKRQQSGFQFQSKITEYFILFYFILS
jgi:hypothetical protein